MTIEFMNNDTVPAMLCTNYNVFSINKFFCFIGKKQTSYSYLGTQEKYWEKQQRSYK